MVVFYCVENHLFMKNMVTRSLPDGGPVLPDHCPVFTLLLPVGFAGECVHHCPLLSTFVPFGGRWGDPDFCLHPHPTPFGEAEIHAARTRCCLIGVVLSAGASD
jgi:hypothetical protein